MVIRNGKLIQELAEKIAQQKNSKSTGLAAMLLAGYIVYLCISKKDDDADFEREIESLSKHKH